MMSRTTTAAIIQVCVLIFMGRPSRTTPLASGENGTSQRADGARHEAAGQFPLASNVYAFDCRGNNAPTMFGKTICYEKRPQPKPRAL